MLGCGHLILTLKAKHGNLGSTGSNCSTSNVDCNVTTTNDNGITLQSNGMILIYSTKEVNTSLYTFCIFARNACKTSTLHTDCDEECLVTLLTEFLNRYIRTCFTSNQISQCCFTRNDFIYTT